jgi:hypothetical protein
MFKWKKKTATIYCLNIAIVDSSDDYNGLTQNEIKLFQKFIKKEGTSMRRAVARLIRNDIIRRVHNAN